MKKLYNKLKFKILTLWNIKSIDEFIFYKNSNENTFKVDSSYITITKDSLYKLRFYELLNGKILVSIIEVSDEYIANLKVLGEITKELHNEFINEERVNLTFRDLEFIK